MKLLLSLIVLTCWQIDTSISSELEIKKVKTIEFGSSSKEILDSSLIKLLVWNQYKGKKSSWLKDFRELKSDKDILILQETTLKDEMGHEMSDDEIFQHIMAISFGKTGVSTASVVSPLSYYAIKTKTREVYISTPKVALLSFFPITNCLRPLMVINIHGINVVTHASNRKQLRKLIEEVKKYDGPVIFAGDFNTWAKKRISFLNKVMEDVSLSPVEFSNDSRMEIFGNPLDHIYMRGFNLLSSKVWGEINGSDHKALTATLSLKYDTKYCRR